jgi:uncharacterized protein YndB with AHSA1/START domain
MPEIRHYIEVDAPAEKVFDAVTTQAGLAGWWTVQVEAQPEVGSILVFDFPPDYHNEMRLTGLEPNKRVEWECLVGHREWVGTKFVFDIEGRGGKTTVRFAQSNWRDATDFYARCNTTWAFYMYSLRDYCEKGEGSPFPTREP